MFTKSQKGETRSRPSLGDTMGTLKWMLMPVLMSVFLPLSLFAQEDPVMSFFRQIEGDWEAPISPDSENSSQRSYKIEGNQVVVRGQSYSENEKGQYLFTAFLEELSVREGKLFLHQNSSEGESWVELEVLNVSPTQITYLFTKTSDVVYSRITILELRSGEFLSSSESVYIDGEMKSGPKVETFVRGLD